MKRQNLTGKLVSSFQCAPKKRQSLFWDAKTPGLGLRVTNTGNKSYIFETKLHGKTLRLTIGSAQAWLLGKAQEEAARLKVMTDQGIDPREVEAAKRTAAIAEKQKKKLECITFGEVWQEYITLRKPHWSESHFKDHLKMVHPGGATRYRSKELTVPGSLASFINVNLKDISSDQISQWAQKEIYRPTQARLAIRLIRAFFNWCSQHPIYKNIVTDNAAKNKSIREILGKPKVKNDVLQREQLSAWFDSVIKIQNPVISAYLQTLLLIGARREELARLRWEDLDFQWNSLTIKDKVENFRIIPLTPYIAHLLSNLPRRSEWVFSSPTAASGRLAEPRIAHNKALAAAGVPPLTLHGLRRSFASLCEWVEMPAGIAAQIQGHKPQGVREQNYIRRPLDLLRMWHIKIEAWILEQAGIEYSIQQHRLHTIK
jgi:integrase